MGKDKRARRRGRHGEGMCDVQQGSKDWLLWDVTFEETLKEATELVTQI